MRAAAFRRILIAVALVAAMAFSQMRPAQAFLDKTRFVAHLGIAYFVFHHWVMKPYQQGSFAQGAPHRTAAIVKAGIALLFAVHEVHVSEKIAQKSKDPLLQKLDASVAGLETTFSAVGAKMKGGQFSPQDVSNLSTQTTDVSTQAAAGGATIKDVAVPVPGT